MSNKIGNEENNHIVEIKELFQDKARKPEGRLPVLFTGGLETW